jgi:DMSO reductase anchor subunit
MNPAFSIVFFTTLAGSAQGLVVALALAVLAGRPPSDGLLQAGLGLAFVLLVVALAASFLHLGSKLKAWRAVLMWRTSWMSREVIVMPAFMAVVALWWLAALGGVQGAWTAVVLPLAALLLSVALWVCTAMIYACLKFIQEWAHPLTTVNYTLIGLSSGLVLLGALAVVVGERQTAAAVVPWALAATLAAWAGRAASLRRNARLKHTSTVQSATGLKASRVVQKSMGFTAGSYNTREFFHRASMAAFRRIKLAFLVLGFAVPALLLAWGLVGEAGIAFLLALPLQYAGLVAERWFFFAQAKHPQNLYYQTVS